MFDKLDGIEARYQEIERSLADNAILSDYSKVAALAQERAELQPIVETYQQYRRARQQRADTQAMLESERDPELRAMARDEMLSLDAQIEQLEAELKRLLLPKDPRDEKNVILEIRAGTGGDEAGLFAADLLRMYMRYAESKGWQTEIMSANESGIGGYSTVTVFVKGRGAFSRLKYESGVHRVQRVPAPRAKGASTPPLRRSLCSPRWTKSTSRSIPKTWSLKCGARKAPADSPSIRPTPPCA